MTKVQLFLLFLLCVGVASAKSPAQIEQSTYMSTPYNSNLYEPMEEFSDEFNNKRIDYSKWDIPEDIFAAWTFKQENVKLDGKGNLLLTAKHDIHTRRNQEFSFSSGMLRSKTTTKYGYYEARVKGADIWPGVCSAFWLYSKVLAKDIKDQRVDAISYNEIDVMELQQIARSKRMMACNLHVMVLKENNKGQLVNDFIKAGQYPSMGMNHFPVDWDPEEDYHIYACENRPDSVVFYIDNKRVASKPNYFWHLDEGMYVTLSLGMRTPYETYKGGRQPIATTKEQAAEAGFPTDMIVDYVRAYTRDYTSFPSLEKPFNRDEFKK
ncbi:MAG: family 16 glycosylhydrolase [Rikenellaceae bacterium]